MRQRYSLAKYRIIFEPLLLDVLEATAYYFNLFLLSVYVCVFCILLSGTHKYDYKVGLFILNYDKIAIYYTCCYDG